jgi:glycosyltransferase involved in cell wall biosynthesis
MISENYPRAKEADIALLMEGSYPFVVGGVSHWTHQMINAFPQYKFAVIFIGSSPEDYKEGMRYHLPENVVHFETHYLYSIQEDFIDIKKRKNKSLISFNLLQDFLAQHNEQIADKFQGLNFYIDIDSHVKYEHFFYSRPSWDFIVNNYTKYCTDPSFIDYFWNIMNIQRPLWQIASIVENFIKVKMIHTISTGYAGFFGALLNFYHHYPLVLTEHGIYTKERRIELLQTKLIGEDDPTQRFATEMSYIRNLWMRYFDLLARICYRVANPITSLFTAARDKQIEEGAQQEKTVIIPNGIDIAKFSKLRALREEKIPPILCLIGRVVSIKDVKTFIRAMNVIVQHIPKAQGWVAGPVDEEPEYFQECKNLVAVLELEDHIEFFPGRQDVTKIFPRIGLMVLSSISEGMPLVVLEGFAAGVPAVTTNVGACRELIFGGDAEDKKLGAAGEVVHIANPQALADAAVRLLQNPENWQHAQQAAITRVETYFDQQQMFAKFNAIYEKILRGS